MARLTKIHRQQRSMGTSGSSSPTSRCREAAEFLPAAEGMKAGSVCKGRQCSGWCPVKGIGSLCVTCPCEALDGGGFLRRDSMSTNRTTGRRRTQHFGGWHATGKRGRAGWGGG
jgi:hypothetical protein